MPLSPNALAKAIIDALDPAKSAILLSAPGSKPIVLATSAGGDLFRLRVFGWNITHGGATRSSTEYRIQITGHVPDAVAGQQTLIVGWSEQYEVFAAWDPVAHLGRDATSPSLQVSSRTLEAAYDNGLHAEVRGSGDVVIAMKPEMLLAYAAVAGEIHLYSPSEIVAQLNEIPASEASDLPQTRNRVIRTVETYYRAWDFGGRVLAAYGHRCAICGTQLGLVEAAHIVPVASDGSNDMTSNGLALCRNHHRAYDARILNVDHDYVVHVSAARLAELHAAELSIGSEGLLALDGSPLLVLPASTHDHPSPDMLRLGAAARRWRP